ncbi:hypothetical protein OF846_000229 [Rhodotorula toruloides]|nr:hypothetical protein OF846_000229 [Rhodotorula toruloides]
MRRSVRIYTERVRASVRGLRGAEERKSVKRRRGRGEGRVEVRATQGSQANTQRDAMQTRMYAIQIVAESRQVRVDEKWAREVGREEALILNGKKNELVKRVVQCAQRTEQAENGPKGEEERKKPRPTATGRLRARVRNESPSTEGEARERGLSELWSRSTSRARRRHLFVPTMCGTLVVHTVLQLLDAPRAPLEGNHRFAKRAASFDEHSSPRPPPGSTAAGHLSAHMLRFRAHSPATSQGSGDEGERRGTAVLTFLAQEDRVGRCWTMQGGPARGTESSRAGRRVVQGSSWRQLFRLRLTRDRQALLSEAQVVCEERHCCLPAVQGRIAFSPSLPLPFALSLASPHV